MHPRALRNIGNFSSIIVSSSRVRSFGKLVVFDLDESILAYTLADSDGGNSATYLLPTIWHRRFSHGSVCKGDTVPVGPIKTLREGDEPIKWTTSGCGIT